MADATHNRDMSRDRVQARRAARKQAAQSKKAARTSNQPPTDSAHKARPRHVRERLRQQSSTQRSWGNSLAHTAGQAHRRMGASFTAATDVLRHRRQQNQAHRDQKRSRPTTEPLRTPPAESHVRRGPRQLFFYWLQTGRFASLLLFLGSLGILIYMFVSPQFSIQQVEVNGNSVMPSNAIAELSELTDASIWFVDTAHASEQLLRNAYIEQATVQISIPNVATINVIERQPDVRWQVGNVQYLLDASGVVLDIATEPAEPGTLVITASPPELQPNEHVDPNALELARALSLRLPYEVGFTPAVIGWDIALGVYVKSQSGQTIVFGRTDNLDRKLAVFRYLLEDGTVFSYLDLRPSNPFYRTEG